MNFLENIKNRLANLDITTTVSSVVSSITAANTEEYVQAIFSLISIASFVIGFYNSNKKLLIEVEIQDEDKRRRKLENDLIESDMLLKVVQNNLEIKRLQEQEQSHLNNENNQIVTENE
jgi:hypothetical protein